MVDKKSKTPGVVIEQIRAAILDGLYKPGERLMEADVAAKFNVSRSPVREALQALESEGTLVAAPYSGAMVRPLSTAEIDEIAEIRLALIGLAVKPAYRHLDLDHAYDLAKRLTRIDNAKESDARRSTPAESRAKSARRRHSIKARLKHGCHSDLSQCDPFRHGCAAKSGLAKMPLD